MSEQKQGGVLYAPGELTEEAEEKLLREAEEKLLREAEDGFAEEVAAEDYADDEYYDEQYEDNEYAEEEEYFDDEEYGETEEYADDEEYNEREYYSAARSMTDTERLAQRYGLVANTSSFWGFATIIGFILLIAGFTGILSGKSSSESVFFLLSLAGIIFGTAAMLAGVAVVMQNGFEKEKLIGELKTKILEEGSEDILRRCRYGKAENFPKPSLLAWITSLGYTPQVRQKAMIEGICENRANFQFMDVTVSQDAVVGSFIGNTMLSMLSTNSAEDDIGDDEYYTWIVFRSAKRVESPVSVVSWDMRNMHKVMGSADCFETEDVAFNSAFCCCCVDRSEAFYVLTPRLMQKLHEFYKERCLEGKPSIAFAFVEHELHIVLRREHTIFDFDGVKEIDGERRLNMLREEFETVTKLAELLEDDIREGDYY